MKKNNYPASMQRPVRWGDMDALGHVNNAVYFKYFEDARIHMFEEMGYTDIQPNALAGPILAQIGCQYLRQLTYPDTVTVGVWVEKIGTTSIHIHHEVFSHGQQAIVAHSSSVTVMVNYTTGEKVAIDEELRQRLSAFQRTEHKHP